MRQRATDVVIRLVATMFFLSAATKLAKAEEPCGMREGDNLCLGCECGLCDVVEERESWNITILGEKFMTIRVRFVSFRDQFGNNPAATGQEIDDQLQVINDAFEPYGIRFVRAVSDSFENSASFRTFCPSGSNCWCPENPADCLDPVFGIPLAAEGWLKQAHAVDPDEMLNIFITDLQYANGILGLGYFPWWPYASDWLNGILIHEHKFGGASDCEGEQSCRLLVHEIGHNLGLWHTFHPYGCECEPPECDGTCNPSFPECDLGSDLCCDTPVSAMGSLQLCEDGTDGVTASCGDGEYGPADYTNYMDYALDGCWDHFSPQQVRRMHCWVCNAMPGWIDSPDCNNNDIPDVCEITRGQDRDCDSDNILDHACEATGSAGACCLSNQAGDCVRTPTSACCSALNGLNWYGLGSRCQTTDCTQGPMGPQGP